MIRAAAGDLDDLQRAAFEGHLSGCARCAGEMAGLRAASGVFAAARTPAPEPPANLASRVLDRIAAESPAPAAPARRLFPRPGALRGTLALSTAAAAVALVLIARNVPMGPDALVRGVPPSASTASSTAAARKPADALGLDIEPPAQPPKAAIAKDAPSGAPSGSTEGTPGRLADSARPALDQHLRVAATPPAPQPREAGSANAWFDHSPSAPAPRRASDRPNLMAPAGGAARVRAADEVALAKPDTDSGSISRASASAVPAAAATPAAAAAMGLMAESAPESPDGPAGTFFGAAAPGAADGGDAAGSTVSSRLACLDSEPEARLRAESVERVYMSSDERAKTILRY